MNRFHHQPRPVRSGFTLLEVLIVVSLITILMAFLTMAIGRSITQAREAATRATLLKIDGMLQQRLEAFRTLMDTPQKQSEIKSRLNFKKQEMQNASITGLHDKMLQLMVYKDYYRNGFPQRWQDNPSLNTTGQPFEGNASDRLESSEMLYWILTQADTFGVSPVDSSEFSSSEVADADGDGRLELVDAWGQPLRFYRWPTRLLRPGGPATPINRSLAGLMMKGLPAAATASGDVDPLTLDPDDQLGVYLATVNASVMTPAEYEAQYHTPDTYHLPLIVSGGADKDTGMNEPFDATSSVGRLASATAASLADILNSALNDNLTNRQKQN